MLKDIRSLNIQGTRFVNPTELPLFYCGGKAAKAVVIYGRNGAGKSTIAHAFRKIKGLEVDNIQSASVHGDQAAPITLDEEEKSHIYVFDEEFVDQNVRVDDNGLGPIVMLGEQVGLTAQINALSEQLVLAQSDSVQKKATFDEYNNSLSPISPRYYLNRINAILQKDDGWAGRKREIEHMRRNPSVSDSTYKQIVSHTPSKSRKELSAEYLEERDKFNHAESGDTKITTDIPSIPDFISSYDTEKINSLLSQAIERPELTEREQYLLQLVQSGKSTALQATALEFNNPEIVVCPKCFQTITQSYKESLIESIQKVLSRTVEDHQEKLSESLLPPLELDFGPFEKLPSYQAGLNIVKTINQIIENNNSLIQAKINNPYSPINERLIELLLTLAELQDCRKQLESERREYNNNVSDVPRIKKSLLKIIDEIAYWDIIELVKQYDKQVSEKERAEKAYHDAVSVCTELQRQISELQSQLANIHIAIDVINNGLAYIFFSTDRMSISAEDGVYRLYSNGRLVKPKDVSVGERNIIGLCYFFARILKDKDPKLAYSEEYLLVIDDPISSFDLENRIGILSYLKYELGLFLIGNADSRAMILTHDLMTLFDVEKIYKELNAVWKNTLPSNAVTAYGLRELKDNQIETFKFKERNEYSVLIQLVYGYAKGDYSEYEVFIGNIMRQVLEAFSTFEYKTGIEDVSTNESILVVMDQDFQEHYRNFMYRLVLHGGSHREEQVRSMKVDFFNFISESAKRTTAKEVLCFMRQLNAPHVKAHLGADAMADIDSWCEEIRNRITSAP